VVKIAPPKSELSIDGMIKMLPKQQPAPKPNDNTQGSEKK
jgi:hypothetical protein